MNDFKSFIGFFLMFTFSCSFSQVKNNKIVLKKIPQEYAIKQMNVQSLTKEKFINIEEFLPKGYVKDGSRDYTSVVQNVLDKNRNVNFPAFPILVNEKGLTVSSNSKLNFPRGSKLILKSNALERYEVLRLHNINNVVLIGPTIVGDRSTHQGSKGEWGMGISIRGAASNIEIYNANISNCWGDGIYIGHLKQIAPKNIKISNSSIETAYRNGISITCGEDVQLSNLLVFNNNYNGIKIEPSNSAAIFKKLLFKNITTFNNYDAGISVGGLSKLIGVPQRQIELEIVNHIDDGSKNGLFFGLISAKEANKNPIQGYIKVINPQWKNNKDQGFVKRKFYNNAPSVQFNGLNNALKINISQQYRTDKEVFLK